LRILHVITDLNTGGVPLHLLGLASWLHQRGETVRVVSLAPPGAVTASLAERGVPADACRAAGWWDWRAVDRLAGMIREFRPDVVHSLLFHANVAARAACLLAGFDRRRLVCEIQTVEIERRWHLTVDRWTQALCRCIVGNSPSVIEHLAASAGIRRDRLRLIRGGVDTAAIAAAQPLNRVGLGLPLDQPVLLWVGRLDPIKGLDVLVEATGVVARQQPVHLLIAGDGPYRAELERLVVASGLSRRVHLLGMRRDVPRLLKSAEVFVFPSRTEGLPNALLEAMAAALPVVATDVPGCRDVVDSGRTGILVPVDDSAALADAILRVLQDQAWARSLGRAAAEHARRHHDRTVCFERYQSLYREIADVESRNPEAF